MIATSKKTFIFPFDHTVLDFGKCDVCGKQTTIHLCEKCQQIKLCKYCGTLLAYPIKWLCVPCMKAIIENMREQLRELFPKKPMAKTKPLQPILKELLLHRESDFRVFVDMIEDKVIFSLDSGEQYISRRKADLKKIIKLVDEYRSFTPRDTILIFTELRTTLEERGIRISPLDEKKYSIIS